MKPDLGLSVQDEAIRRRLDACVTPDVVAEHRAAPFGPHSPALDELLDFLRRNPAVTLPRYVVLAEDDGYRVGIRPAERGGPVEAAGDERFGDRGAAEHGVFLRRLRDYGLEP